MKKIKLVYISLALGLLSFVHLLGIEKAILAILIGGMALKNEDENKSMAWFGISLGLIYLISIAFIVIFHFPKFVSILEKLK